MAMDIRVLWGHYALTTDSYSETIGLAALSK